MAETTVMRSSAINRTPNNGSAPRAQLSGALPPVMVNMNGGGPRGAKSTVKQGVVIMPPKGAQRRFTTGGLPNQPAKPGVVITTPLRDAREVVIESPLTADQLMLCRHLTDKYLADQRATAGETATEATIDNLKLGEATLVAIDAAMAAVTAAAADAAAEAAASEAIAAQEAAAVQPRAIAAGRSVHGAASAAPRRVVSRPSGPLPPVVIKMESGQPIPVDPADAT